MRHTIPTKNSKKASFFSELIAKKLQEEPNWLIQKKWEDETCPISLERIGSIQDHKKIILFADGHCYHKDELIKWLNEQKISPVTRISLNEYQNKVLGRFYAYLVDFPLLNRNCLIVLTVVFFGLLIQALLVNKIADVTHDLELTPRANINRHKLITNYQTLDTMLETVITTNALLIAGLTGYLVTLTRHSVEDTLSELSLTTDAIDKIGKSNKF